MADASPTAPLLDVKEALSSSRKPDITHVRLAPMVYDARSKGYGDYRYARANYLRPTGGVRHTTPTGDDFRRYRAYLRALVSHALHTLDAMEMHQSTDPALVDVEGMKAACFAPDTDAPPDGKRASGLPHIAMALSSGGMAVAQAVECGLLPRDPGCPWEAATAPPAVVGDPRDADVYPAPDFAPNSGAVTECGERFISHWGDDWQCAKPIGHVGMHADGGAKGFWRNATGAEGMRW